MGSEGCTTQFWMQTRTIKPRCGAADMGNHKETTTIRARCRYRPLLRLRILMPPSRTRKARQGMPEGRIAHVVDGEGLQHMHIYCMKHTA